MRLLQLLAVSVAIFLAVPVYGAEPAKPVKVADVGFDPPEVLTPVSGFATYVPPATVKDVKYIALDGEEPFPVSLIGGDPKAFLFLTRGLAERDYGFIGVASDASGKLYMKRFAVRVGKPAAPPPKVKDPAVPSEALYFLIVRPDGPATSHFTKLMADPAWDTLRKAGHTVKDFGVTAASKWVPAPDSLPAVATLRESGDKSVIVRASIPLPTTSAAILDLPKLK